MTNQPIETHVLIVGAGPTGLALAAELRRRGETPLVIDRSPNGANTSRAAAIHARTLEVLEPLGVTPTLLQQGVKVPIFRVRDRDRELIHIDFARIPSAYPFTLMCPQDRTECILLERLEAMGGTVLRPTELQRFDEHAAGIDVEIATPQGAQRVRTRWLVGCDGMHSRVRAEAGISFEGAAYEESFVLADVRMDWPLSSEEVSLFLSDEGLVVVAPLPDQRFRIVATLADAPESPSAELMQDLLNRRGPARRAAKIRDVVWSARFRIHHRVAATPRKGRVLLCGDAAHVHSPAGGQGMNTGIQDGVSLANALSATLRDGDESRLDTWAKDRHRVATEVVAMTDRLTRIATLKSSAGKLVRNAAIGLVGQLPPVRTAIAKNLAELNVR
jgi:2-polyprenyl-6-methoxyphenol hydroxylase-like FAD-dependent oxidoreductase